jgi:nitroreductase
VVSIVGDPTATARWLGERSFRVLNAEAGIVAQRVCLGSAAAGLAARPYNSYRADGVAALLGISGAPLVPIFQIAVGRPRVAPTLRMTL